MRFGPIATTTRAALRSAPLLALLASCGGAPAPAAPAFEPKGQTRCGVTKSQARPLIVEWPSADRLDLEAQARKGLVAVHYAGCEMEVLRHCKGPGEYKYIATTRQDDLVRIRDEDELYANIPVYAAKFEGALRRAGELNVSMAFVGTYEADRYKVRMDELSGDCARATHVVTSLTAGAFEFFAGAGIEASAGAGVLGAGAGGKTASQRETLNRAGDKVACGKARRSDKEPPDGCGALLRVEVVPLATDKAAPAQITASAQPAPASAPAPAQPTRSCPSGMNLMRGGTMVLSSAAVMPDRRWGLLADAPAPAPRPSRVTVESFCMDRAEVSQQDYTSCVRNNQCDAERLLCGKEATYGASGKGYHPINCVDYAQASNYCRARGKRLPTSWEWEWAARGGNQALRYPWGMEYNLNRRLCLESTCDTSSSGGDNPFGIHNLIGNVWEWTSTETDDGNLVLRGAGFREKKPELFLVRTSHGAAAPAERRVDVGFRCVK